MRLLLPFLLIFLACVFPFPHSSQAKLTNKELAAMMATKAKQQQEIIDQTLQQLKGSQEAVGTLGLELKTAQDQIAQVDKERSNWKLYADDQHDKWINAEKRVSDEKVKTLRCYIIIGSMTLLIGIYAVAKFYFRLPI